MIVIATAHDLTRLLLRKTFQNPTQLAYTSRVYR